MDLISILKADHRNVDDLFERFQRHSARARKARETTVSRIVSELSLHAQVEEQVLYPILREQLPDLVPTVLESLEEHRLVDWELSTIAGLPADDEHLDAKMSVLRDLVRHHVDEEEHDLFPKLRTGLSRRDLQDLGGTLRAAKRDLR